MLPMRFVAQGALLLSILTFVDGCGGRPALELDAAGTHADTAIGDGRSADGGASGRPMFTPGTSWQWQLSGTIDLSVDAQVFDIDPFSSDTQSDIVAQLHARGRRVICYFDTAYEPGRVDSAALEPYKGNPLQGWPGQYWVDFRQPAVRAVMKARIERAHALSCDAVEPDDVDVLDPGNEPGFPITAADQLEFLHFLADTAHQNGMAVGLKNNVAQIPQLVATFDFAVNEQCAQYDECETYAPFIAANKAVFNTEYTATETGSFATKANQVCAAQNARNFDTIIKHLALGAERFSCR